MLKQRVGPSGPFLYLQHKSKIKVMVEFKLLDLESFKIEYKDVSSPELLESIWEFGNRCYGSKSLDNVRRLTYKDVIQAIIDEYDVTDEFMASLSRARRNVDPRMIFCYIMNIKLSWSLVEIGQLLGGRDHTTVIHGRETFRRLYHNEEPYRERADRVFKKLMIKAF
jgi:hypothetical protein